MYNAQYLKPQRVWIDEGNVFVKSHGGAIVSMTPEAALELSRLIGVAGAESLVYKVMTQVASQAIDPNINEINKKEVISVANLVRLDLNIMASKVTRIC